MERGGGVATPGGRGQREGGVAYLRAVVGQGGQVYPTVAKSTCGWPGLPSVALRGPRAGSGSGAEAR